MSRHAQKYEWYGCDLQHIRIYGLHPYWFQRHLNSRFWYVTSNYLQWSACSLILAFLAALIDTLPWTYTWNLATSVYKGIVKICLDLDVLRSNWSWIVVAGCGLRYFFSARFGSFWIVNNFIAVECFIKTFGCYKIVNDSKWFNV